MHFDLAHALITAAILFVVLALFRRFFPKETGSRFDWRLFLVVFVVIFIFNLIWPVA